jgi:RHS repeat-associated protein
VGSLGHESEGNTGLIYMRARYMDPVLGRFISEDPSKDGANWFVYCGDEPVNLVDTSGRAAKCLLDAFKSGIIAFILFLELGYFMALGYYLASLGSTEGFNAAFGSKKWVIAQAAAGFGAAFLGEYFGSAILSNFGSLKDFIKAAAITAGVSFFTGVVIAVFSQEAMRQGWALFCIFLIDHPED